MLDGLVSEATFAEIQKIENRARGGMTSAERIAYLKVRKDELYTQLQKLQEDYAVADEYYQSIKDDETISQSVKDLALIEKDNLNAEVKHIRSEHTHASNDISLWETGLQPAKNVQGYQQALEPQPFVDYVRESFDLNALKKERLLELAFEGHKL